jgi:hypothetical protein
MVATLVRTIFEQPDHDSVWAQHARVVDQLAGRFDDAALMLADAADDLLAFSTFPAEHWSNIRSNNPQVIWSREEGVCDVDDRRLGHPVLRAGRGYLEGSSTQGSGRLSVRPTGGVAPLAA